MLDIPQSPSPVQDDVELPADTSGSSLPTETRPDGTLVIDLTGLAPPPTECVTREPDPFNPEIIVCRELQTSPRLGPDYGPTADEVIEGSAVPRARLRLSDDAEAQANVINKGVGGFNANGAEARVRIDF